MDQFINKLDLLYSRRHSSPLPPTVFERIINLWSQIVIYVSMMVDTFINGFSRIEEMIHLHIYDHSNIYFG